MSINPGELNRKITFQTKSAGTNANGYPTGAWTDSSTRWAAVKSLGSRELFAAQKVNVETSVVFKLRYSSAINEQMRVSYGGRYYEIIGIDAPDNVEMLVMAKEMK